MENYFASYKQAKDLKELGFDEKSFRVYDTMGFLQEEKIMDELKLEKIYAPLFSQAFKWFRELSDWPIEVYIKPFLSDQPMKYEGFYWRRGEEISIGTFKTHEEAESELLNRVIEILKNEIK